MICFIRRSTHALRILFTSDFFCVQSFFIKCVERAKKREQSSNGRFIWAAIHLTVIQPLTFAVRIIREWEILTDSQLLGKRVVNSRQIGCSICWNDYHVCWHNCRIISKIYFSNSKTLVTNMHIIYVLSWFGKHFWLPLQYRIENNLPFEFQWNSTKFSSLFHCLSFFHPFRSRSLSFSHPGRSHTLTKSSYTPTKFSHDHKNKYTYKHQSINKLNKTNWNIFF